MTTPSYRSRADLVPFEGASDLHVRLARSFALVTDWIGAVTGRYDFAQVLRTLATQTGARSVMVYRVALDTRQVALVRSHDRLTDSDTAEPAKTVARHVVDAHGADLEVARMFRLSDLANDGNASVAEYGARHGLHELSLLVLSSAQGHVDFLEMAFESAPNRSPEIPPSLVATALADGWGLRTPGLIAAMIAERARARRGISGAEGDLWSPQNPYGLTATELKVCRELVQGHAPKTIAGTLSVSVATVRSHLSNLYSKTGTSGQLQLLALAGVSPDA